MIRSRLIAVVALIFAASPSWAAVIGFDLPGGDSFAVSQTFTLDLTGSGFAVPLDGGGVNLQFDPSVLQVESVSVDTSVWDFAPVNGTIDNTNGVVEDILFNALLNPSPSGNFDIASVEFLALGAGSTSLLLSASASNPFSSGGVPLNPGTDFVFANSSVEVTGGSLSVPEPSTAALWLAAFLVMAGAQSLRRSRSS